MKFALLGRKKLGFIDGTCLRNLYKEERANQWDQCNAIVFLWISSTVSPKLISSTVMASSAKKLWDEFAEWFDKSNFTRIYQLSKETATLMQGMDSVTLYYSKLKDAWNELDLLAPAPVCDYGVSKEYIEHMCNQRLLQFLMGLNESFSHIRSDILLRSPVLTVNQAYAVVIQEES